MFDRDDKDQGINELARKVCRAAAVTEADIENVIARGAIFDRVVADIRAREAETPNRSGSFVIGKLLSKAGLALAGSIAVVLIVVGVALKQNPAGAVSVKEQVPGIAPERARLDITPQVTVKGFTAGRAAQSTARTTAEFDHAVYTAPPRRSARIPRDSKRSEREEPEFYPVTYTGDSGELVKGGRVIRVEVSRATLFALGINIPLENETASLKADLVIGPDGMTRALRLVE